MFRYFHIFIDTFLLNTVIHINHVIWRRSDIKTQDVITCANCSLSIILIFYFVKKEAKGV